MKVEGIRKEVGGGVGVAGQETKISNISEISWGKAVKPGSESETLLEASPWHVFKISNLALLTCM